MRNVKDWYSGGAPWVWLNAGAVAISLVMVAGMLLLIGARGLVHFWPADVVRFTVEVPGQAPRTVLGEIQSTEMVSVQRLIDAGTELPVSAGEVERLLIKKGNRDSFGADFEYLIAPFITGQEVQDDVITIERTEWGNQYGVLVGVSEDGVPAPEGSDLYAEFQARVVRVLEIRDRIHAIERGEMSAINYRLEKLRLEERRLALEGADTAVALAAIEDERATLQATFLAQQQDLGALYVEIARDSYSLELADGRTVTSPMERVVSAIQPNAMGGMAKLGRYARNIWRFMADEPREANTAGGVFPAIFGTVMMVILMSIIVTPFGVVAAVYLREYAKQGVLTQTIRIAVNNLAGVPSIVYGVFGLGFFVYLIGGSLDRAFYPEGLPAPTFGTPGLIWASLTLALLSLPVVIVATEEGLSRIPSTVREASYALGATKAETLWRIVLPMASPAMMTGLILAVARAAGEVAPLMLVGVVKLAPSLPLDGNEPFLHLERKFMHLGFHIYDVGFQSPNVEAARPLVYATALLLVTVIVVLNLTAVRIRNRLRERYRSLEH